MAYNKKIKSKRVKSKLDPVPHNNRGHANGRISRAQIIYTVDKNDPTIAEKKTVFHFNLSPYAQGRIHLMKVAAESNDLDILKKLTPSERKYYNNLLKEKEAKELNDTDNGNKE